MLVTRIITGIIGGALTIFVIYEGNWLFFLTILLLAFLGWREYASMVAKVDGHASTVAGAIWMALFFGAWWFESPRLCMLLFFVLMAGLLIGTVVFHNRIKPLDSACSLYGLLYIGGGFLSMLAIRNGMIGSFTTEFFNPVMAEPSRFLMFLLIFSTWASDTFAFAFGKALGKVKLCPSISPGKTREGALGGFIGTIVIALIVSFVFGFALIHGLAMGIIIAIMAPLGDLVESILKRNCGIKDSGNIIPGHGGVLDRFDSLLLAAPAVYLYLLFVV